MMDLSWLSRTELLIGKEKLMRLAQKHVLVMGLGGVGSFAAEFIARGGVGKMTIADGDVVDPSNRNRQLPALATNHGCSKAEWMRDRLLAINPELQLTVHAHFVQPNEMASLIGSDIDFVIDAIDSISPKLNCIKSALDAGVPVVSAMGAGGRMDPSKIEVADIAKTYNCPFAQQVRKQLKPLNIRTGFQAVFSSEQPAKEALMHTDGSNYKKSAYGTISYMPAMFGATAASVVLRNFMDEA